MGHPVYENDFHRIVYHQATGPEADRERDLRLHLCQLLRPHALHRARGQRRQQGENQIKISCLFLSVCKQSIWILEVTDLS